MTLYEELKARGLVAQITDEEIIDLINNGKATFYIGFDCITDGITFHSTPQWLFPYLLSGKVLPDVQSCRLRDIFWHLPQMHLQSLQ